MLRNLLQLSLLDVDPAPPTLDGQGAHQHIINSHQQSQLYANCSYAANGFVQDLDLQQMFPVVSGYRSEVPNGL